MRDVIIAILLIWVIVLSVRTSDIRKGVDYALDVGGDAEYTNGSLSSRLDDVEMRLDEVESTDFSHSGDIYDMQAVLDDLTLNQIRFLENDIEELQRDVRNLEWNN